MNRDVLLADAKARVLDLAPDYVMPRPRRMTSMGRAGIANLDYALWSFQEAGQASAHDVRIGHEVAVILAGGGIRRGAVIGASDATASYPTAHPYGIQDLLRTVFHLLGVDADKIYTRPLGRPVPIVNAGHRIDELLS